MTTTHANRTSLPLAGGTWRDRRRFTPLAGPCSAVPIGLQFTPAPLVTGQRRARPTTRAKVQQA